MFQRIRWGGYLHRCRFRLCRYVTSCQLEIVITKAAAPLPLCVCGPNEQLSFLTVAGTY